MPPPPRGPRRRGPAKDPLRCPTQVHPRLQERHRPPHRRLRLQPRPGDGLLRRRPGRGAGRQATPRRRGGGHRCAEGGVASRRRRRRRQDRRRRRHPRRDPAGLLQDHVRDSSGQAPEVGRIAVGMVFLPRTDLGAQERCRIIVETEILRFGHTILGWRQVPVDISVIGEKANATRPEIEQILIGRGNPQLDNREFEKQLYILRRRMEKAAIAENIGEFYVCSLSLPLGRLQGHVPGRASVGLLSRPARRALHLALRHLPPALLDQHLPAMEARPAVPRAGAQRRDQHHPGQRQLDEEPRGPPRARRLRPRHRGPEAHHPARGVGFLGARQRLRAAGARPSQPADGQADDDPRGLVLEPQRAGQAPRDVQLRERRHGAVGRAGRHRRRRRQVGAGRHGPQWAPAHALRAHLRRAADRRLRGRHGAAGRRQDRREGPARPGRDAGRRHGRPAALQGPRAEGHARRHPRLRPVDDAHRRAQFADQAGRAGHRAFRGRRAAPPPVRRRLVDRGSGDDPPSHGRGRQGSRRLDGRRRAARGAVATPIAACTTSSARTSARSPTRRSTPCASATS